jgi:hypothetical protein
MKVNFNRIKQLETENMILKSEIQRLKNLLEDVGVNYSDKNSAHQGTNEVLSIECIVNKNITTVSYGKFLNGVASFKPHTPFAIPLGLDCLNRATDTIIMNS